MKVASSTISPIGLKRSWLLARIGVRIVDWFSHLQWKISKSVQVNDGKGSQQCWNSWAVYKNVGPCIMQNVASLYLITVGSTWKRHIGWATNFDQQMNIDAHCYLEKRHQANRIHRYHQMIHNPIDIPWLGHYHPQRLNDFKLKTSDTRSIIYPLVNRCKWHKQNCYNKTPQDILR